jgi:hypothetical protein
VKKERNYYLIGLLIFGAIFISFLGYMIRIAIQNPVEMDSSHMMAYREFDANYNKIAEMEKQFDSMYVISFAGMNFRKDTNATLELNITAKNASKAADANVTVLLTRPDSSKHDVKITEFSKKGNSYVSKPFVLPLEGRWKLIYKVQIGETQKFIDLETFVNKQN